MKTLLFIVLILLTVLFGACHSGPGGPAQNAGRAVDNAVYTVGGAVERTGQKIQEAAD